MPKFSVKKPLTVFVAVIAILVLGVVAYLKMTPDLLPNMNFPYVIIVTTDPGASPESVESTVTKPMEQTMATLDQIKSLSSTSRDSVSMVMLEFEESVNMDAISVDIQQKISALQGAWDDTVGTPYVLKINPSMLPVEVVAISYEGKNVEELSDFVEDVLTSKMEGISGVASVDISGMVEQQMNILLSQEKLDKLSEQLREAIEKQMAEAKKQLQDARAQVQSAKNQLQNAQTSGIEQAVTEAVKVILENRDELEGSRDEMQDTLDELNDIVAKKEVLDAENAVYQERIDAIENNPALSAEEKAQQIAAIRAEPRYVELQAELAALDLRLAALGLSWEDVDRVQDGLEGTLGDLNDQLDAFLQDEEAVAELTDQVSEGVLMLTEAVQQIIMANIQLDSALAQIDDGLKTLEESRETALNQADLSKALNISTITSLLTAQNFSMPAGYLQEEGISYMVSVGDTISASADLQNMVLFDLGLKDMEAITLQDVADVFFTDNTAEIYAKLNGDDSVIATFTKQSNYATAETSNNIAARFEELSEEYSGLKFTPLMDQGDYIYMIIESILSSLGWGAVFAVLILYLFLRDLRPTIITLLSIPISVIFAIVLMYFSGVTINMISLSGLAVAVGMLVDNSVVVIENIYRLRSKGATVRQAAVSGAGQVLGAVTASTLTTVCVFAPIVFVEGLTRQLFTDLALTMTYALLASLVVALTLVPAMASGMLKRALPQKAQILDRIYPAYMKAVEWSIHHKAVVLLASVVLLVSSAVLAVGRGFIFMPEMDMNTFNVAVTMPENISREEAVELADEVLRRIETVEHVETAGAQMSGGGGMGMLGGGGSGDGSSYDVTVYVTLAEGESGIEAGKKIQELCEDLDCKVSASGAMDSMTTMMTGSGVSLNLYGDNMEQLQSAAKEIASVLETVEGTAEVSDGLEDAAPALHVAIDRNAAMKKGITVAQIYMQIAEALTTSASSAEMTLDGTKVDVLVQAPESARLDREKLMALEISLNSSGSMGSAAMMGASSGAGMSSMGGGSAAAMGGMTTTENEEKNSFPLSEVATIEETVSLSAISRSEQRRYLTVTAGVADGHNVTRVTAAVQQAVAGMDLPDGITAQFDGENEMIMEAMEQLLLMLLLGIVLVYLIMVAQFQSLKSPFIVMFTIPLAFTGGFLALLITGLEVSVISMIGFVMLVGIIVNNGIVLVDYINQLRLEGVEREQAIIEAGTTRLRPILMTSFTTILGLIVTALGQDAGTALMQPVAVVCIGGLLYATLMTLFVVPCMYDIMNKKELRKVEDSELEILDI